MYSGNNVNKLKVWPALLLILIFLASCSSASVQDYDNPDFVDVDFYGLDSEVIHSITNSGAELFHVNPIPVIDHYDDGTWIELSEEWGTGVNSLGAYPIYPESTVSIMPNFSLVNDPGLYRIRHHGWFGEDPDIPDAGDDDTFPIVIPFEITE